jgi:GNAT superfamily N-acetyltransferase
MSPAKAAWASNAFGSALPPPPAISKADEEFGALGIEFVATLDGIKVLELNELFEKVGFPRRDPERLKLALANTHRLVWVRATRASRYARLGQLLGFARATSDGVFSATIWDVAVSPAWQRSGLGRAMMERLTRGLVEDGISTITLYAEPQVVGLYKKLGYVDDPDGIKGMAFQRRTPEPAAAGGGGGSNKRAQRAAVAA